MKNRILACIALTLLVIGSAMARRARRSTALPAAGWPKYCGTLSMSGTPLGASPIDTGSAARLTLAWQTSLNGPVASAPSVLRETLYIGDWGGIESAIDVRTGTVLAKADLGRTQGRPSATRRRWGSRPAPPS